MDAAAQQAAGCGGDLREVTGAGVGDTQHVRRLVAGTARTWEKPVGAAVLHIMEQYVGRG
ncbi:hypothetical protein GCM10010207_17610 [Streptomyces atratus]|nr:hypothetical protein GCM10010207_17610 [Streptomyces atratus]